LLGKLQYAFLGTPFKQVCLFVDVKGICRFIVAALPWKEGIEQDKKAFFPHKKAFFLK